ncbi:MAG: hypothetical protein A2340_14895 [Lentisphaerae bacterium RIFOXYB12_FULL_60_10]|nr:MAG: hypothetical protein A2340_14895 [Lentisphaerae bacterium RIFOXYB12_FULL_60_10]
MQYPDEIKAFLLRSGTVTPEQLALAEQAVRNRHIPLETALIQEQILDHARLGECLAAITKLPYRPILTAPPVPEAWTVMSVNSARHWQTLPIGYDADQNMVTLAVHDTEQAGHVESVFRLLLQPYRLTFTIAPEDELNRALTGTGGPATGPVEPGSAAKAPVAIHREPMRLKGLHARLDAKPPAVRPDLPASPAPGKPTHPPAPAKPHPDDVVGRYLVPAAVLLVESIHEKDPESLGHIRSVVRYSQMLAARLDFNEEAVNRTILAAWLSGLMDHGDLVRRFPAPFDLVAWLSLDPADQHQAPPEVLVLGLVRQFQELRRRDPSGSRDINQVRRDLRMAWTSAQDCQSILETFLQLLMDEEFLVGISRGSGRLLVVDPSEAVQASLAPPLSHDGYDVAVVATADEAGRWMCQNRPDLVLLEEDLPDHSGLEVCRSFRQAEETASVPVIMLVKADRRKQAAECLRAGAEDVLVKPVDLELLFLKIQRGLQAQGEPIRSGVSGALEDMGFTDMIQILTAGNRSIELIIQSEQQEGHVFIKDGTIMHAATGDVRGEAAFYEMMRWRTGKFTTRHPADFPAVSIESGTMSLLMEGARLADEQQQTPA